jgi:hypothetical protein
MRGKKMKTDQELLEEHTKSYMCLRFHQDKGPPLELRVPTYWDEEEKCWVGGIKTPISKTLIYGKGKNSKELEQAFNKNMKKAMQSEDTSEEVFSMFKPIKE